VFIGSFYVFHLLNFGGQTTKLQALSRDGSISLKFLIAPSGESTDRIKKVRTCKMARTSSITTPSMVGIAGRTPAVDEKMFFFVFLPSGLRLAQLCRYCFYSMVQKWVFRPAEATRCPVEVKQQKSKMLILLRSTLTLWQCAAKVISDFLIFAVLFLRANDCRPYTPL